MATLSISDGASALHLGAARFNYTYDVKKPWIQNVYDLNINISLSDIAYLKLLC